MRKNAMLTIALLLLSASFARADFYRWVDKDGKEFFTNERDAVPQEYRSGAEAVNPDEKRVSVGKTATAAGNVSAARMDHKDKYGQGEEYWRKRAKKLRKELTILQDKYDSLLKQEKEEEKKTNTLLAGSGGKKTKAQKSREKKKTLLERDLARKKHELEVELPEEARKAEAYPGWLRE